MLADTLDFILDRAIAVNDAGHILCTGHVDGTHTPNTHRLLLTPDVFPAPAVTTLGAVAVTSTGVTFRAKLNACNLPTAATFVHGATTSYGTTNALPPLSATIPMLAEPSHRRPIAPHHLPLPRQRKQRQRIDRRYRRHSHHRLGLAVVGRQRRMLRPSG